MQVSIGAELEIERRLEAYGRARLSPSAVASARLRARVMREARLASGSLAHSLPPVATIDATGTRRRAGLLRRGAGLLLAAALSLGVAGGAMAAAQAGGPLYPTRMWLETVTLPAAGGDRVDAEIARLEARMAEVVAAARSGDRRAVEAALLAYQQIADEAFAAANGDVAAMERLRLALDRHLAVLESVAAKVPPQASEAIGRNIERAIERNAAAIERIQAKPGGPASKPGGTVVKPAPSDKPDKSAKPTPDHASEPQATPPAGDPPKGPPSSKPDKTPPGQDRGSAP